MYEESSVNPSAAQREARRKRILENSAKRLKLIQGKVPANSTTSSESLVEPEPEVDARETNTALTESSNLEIDSTLNDIFTSKNDLQEIADFLFWDFSKRHGDEDMAEEEEVEVEDEMEMEDEVEMEDEMEVEDDMIMEEMMRREKREISYFELLLQKRLHYVMLALSVDIMLFFNVGYLFYENIFCPFYTLKAIELISGKKEKDDFQPVAFLFCAFLPKTIKKFAKIFFNILYALIPDLCIYLFIFVIGAKIMNIED